MLPFLYPPRALALLRSRGRLLTVSANASKCITTAPRVRSLAWGGHDRSSSYRQLASMSTSTAGNLKEGKKQQDNVKSDKEANKSHNKAGNGTAKGAKGLSKQSNTSNKTATPLRIRQKRSRSRRKMAFANVSETRLRNWLRLRGAFRGTADRLTNRDVRLRVFMLGRTRFGKKAWREGWDAEARSKQTKGKEMMKGIRPAKVSKQERSMYMEIFDIMRDSLMKGGTRNKSETGDQEKTLSRPKKLVPSLMHPESISGHSSIVQLPRELGLEARSINRLFMASALKPGKKFGRDPKTGVRRLLPKLSNERATDIIRGKPSDSEGPNERELQELFDDLEDQTQFFTPNTNSRTSGYSSEKRGEQAPQGKKLKKKAPSESA